jgi:ATP-dependent helicase/nuclease subunit B
MAIQFILGRSGTGKTAYCISSIVEALLEGGTEPLLLLVPEQATYQAERAILADSRIAGYHRFHVLSFERLQFLLLGKNTARQALIGVGRQMMVHKLLRENSDRLKVFSLSATSTGLGRRMAETIRELHQYTKTPEDLDRLLNKLQKDTSKDFAALKFADIALIFGEYLKSIEGRFSDPDLQLQQTCRIVADAQLVKGARLWVDGFAGFTGTELVILTELLKAVAEAQIALCLDPSRINLSNPARQMDNVSLFSPTELTYTALIEIVRKHRLDLGKPVLFSKPLRFASCPELAHVEQHVFENKPQRIPASEKIRLTAAANPRAEVRFVARQIVELVKKRNCRYRDIAVIAPDIEGYQHYINAYFHNYGIPFFIDRRTPLNQHPVVHLTCSALEVVVGDFASSDVLSYLKTDLVPVHRSEVDMLENYVVAFGSTGKDWQSEDNWNFAGKEDEDFDNEQIDSIRRTLIAPLLKLRDALRPEGREVRLTAREFVQVLFDFLESLQVRAALTEWIEQANRAGDFAEADQHRQFYDRLVDVFDEMVEVFGDQKMTCSDYYAILASAFSQLALAFIPPTLDQVLVGSIERSRHPDLKAVFLVGASQRGFPAPISSNGVLTDEDRQVAESAGFALAVNTRRRLIERQYLAYIAFSRASEYLFVTYPLADEQGSPECRSQFITDLESLFEDLAEQVSAADNGTVENLYSRSELEDLLCRQLGKDGTHRAKTAADDRLSVLLGALCDDKDLGDLGLRVLTAVSYDNRAALNSYITQQVRGQHLRSSATRLSTFAACPYRYFARYALDLRERCEFKFEPLDVGLFYHRVLDQLFKSLAGEKTNLAEATNEQLLELLTAQIRNLIRTDAFVSNFARHSNYNLFVIRSAGEVLERAVLAIAEMVRAGDFRPSATEIAFGQVKNATTSLGEYKVELPEGRILFLDGKIDRLDVAQFSDGKVAVLFDYKRSGQSFNWSEFCHGLDLQLPIYMLAVRNAADFHAEPAGAFYIPIEVRPPQSAIQELPARSERFGYKARGIFNGRFAHELDKAAFRDSDYYNFYVTKDGQPYGSYATRGALRPQDFEKILKLAEDRVVELAQRILSGEISARPYRLSGQSPCANCKYKPVCRFDWQINDYNVLESVSKSAVLERVG